MNFSVKWNRLDNERSIEEKPVVYHCHHYNIALQKTIEDTRAVDGITILKNSAREVAYEQFKQAFMNHSELTSESEKFNFASQYFKMAGFGLIDFSKVNEQGGIVHCPTSHYAKGYLAKFNRREKPVCHFVAGWIAGVIAAVYFNDLYIYDVAETQCQAVTGNPGCTFKVELR